MKYLVKKFYLIILLMGTAAFLTSCGGGGAGGTSSVFLGILSYPSASITVLEQKTIVPSTSGFEGHAAQCVLTTGSVPLGMILNKDCSLVGTPTSVGLYVFNFKLTALGIDSEAIGKGVINVAPPSIEYKYSPKISTTLNPGVNILTTSDVVLDAPVINASAPWPSTGIAPVSWKFQLTSGQLPPGLKLDSATGVISGKPTQIGSFRAYVGATISSTAGTITIPSLQYFIDISEVNFKYSYDGNANTILGPLNVGWPYQNMPSITPATTNGKANLLSNFSATAVTSIYNSTGTLQTSTSGLPSGLSINPDTGVISGIPISLLRTYSFAQSNDTSVSFIISATLRQGGDLPPVPVTAKFVQDFKLPFYYFYGASYDSYLFTGSVGSSLATPPVIKLVTTPTVTPIKQFSTVNSSSCLWDFGLTLDANTGSITGSPKRSGKFDCSVLATVSINGVAWKQVVPISFDFK